MILTGQKGEILSVINKMPVTALPNYAYHNNGDFTFTNLADQWGLAIPSFSSGCAYGDLDGDGDQDIVVNNVNQEAFVFENRSRQLTKNNFLQFQLKGKGGNAFAIGSSVKLFAQGKIFIQELVPSRGFQSSMDYVLTFGLGTLEKIDSISVLWPDSKLTVLKDVKVNQLLELRQSDAIELTSKTKSIIKPTIFKEITKNIFEGHKEDLFDDFDREGLLTKYVSKEGPALAIGDINGDGHEDVFIGGGPGQQGKVYLHEGDGKLKWVLSKCFVTDEGYEDTSAAFFDADGDGDLDLAVGTGGNDIEKKGSYLTRLYLNNGAGQFVKSASELPSAKTNISVISPFDFDNDGDTDLFVGSRSVPGVFGTDPQHLLLVNNGDASFVDGTERSAYDLKDAGMITDAKWVDIDGDRKDDLVTVSEWGTPIVFKNSGKRLNRWICDLDSLYGWWKAVEAYDFDKDGDLDLVLGNAGLNIPFVATHKNPMKLWVNDFDENGTIEQIMTIHENGKDYPIHMRREMTAQMPSLKKQNLLAEDYAKRTVQELFKSEIVNSSLVKIVSNSESVIAVNDGKGKFSIQSLPKRVQWSCVCGILCTDVNKDGMTDLVMAGNNFDFKPQFSRQDASYGNVLLGNGKMEFQWQDYTTSGFFVRGQVRHLASFGDKRGNKYMFAAINGEIPRVFAYDFK
jgi:hypothetical protein